MKKPRTLSEAHEALRRLREPLDEDRHVEAAYSKFHSKKADRELPARQKGESAHAS